MSGLFGNIFFHYKTLILFKKKENNYIEWENLLFDVNIKAVIIKVIKSIKASMKMLYVQIAQYACSIV